MLLRRDKSTHVAISPSFVDGLELPRGLERELVQDERENLYELNGEDARMLATIGAFRVVAEHDLEDVRDASADPRDDTLDHLADEGLIRFVDIDAEERAAVLTDQGWDVLDANRRDPDDERGQVDLKEMPAGLDLAAASKRLQAARFRVRYRMWQLKPYDALADLYSHILPDQLARGEGRVEFVELSRVYLRLTSLVGVA
jgi:hypothetical protein